MKKFLVLLLLACYYNLYSGAQPTSIEAEQAKRVLANDYLSNDGVLRFYRLALPITNTCFNQNFHGSVDAVKDFWQETEAFVNQLYIPLGICFDVVEDEKLIARTNNSIDQNVFNAAGLGTDLLNEIIPANAYDVGLWIAIAADFDNSGVSVLEGAYNVRTKANGYSENNVITVAHELGHLFGAPHTHDEGSATEPGLGQSVMGYGTPKDFFSLASMKFIADRMKSKNASYYADKDRTKLIGNNADGNYVYGVKVAGNNAPQFVSGNMKEKYQIPQGACFSIDISATDEDNDRITYTFQQYEDGAALPAFAPSDNPLIDYRPRYVLFPGDDYFYPDDNCITTLTAGTYRFAASANDLPKPHDMTLQGMTTSPFRSQYTIYKTAVEIVGGTPFTASLTPSKDHYRAGEKVTVNWGVNTSYFNSNSKLRITLSDDFGETFKYVLAENVPALNGKYEITLPNISFEKISKTFYFDSYDVNPGIIRVEEMQGNAYTLTSYSPEGSGATGGFIMSGGTPTNITPTTSTPPSPIYDLSGKIVRRSATDLNNLAPGVYIYKGKTVIVD